MLSYLHQFHAGNHADVLKHCTLALALKQMQKKAKPLTVFDTHGGRGSYDLTNAQAKKDREFKTGIGHYWNAEAMATLPKWYSQAVTDHQRDENQSHITDYPGSPALVAHMLRPDDQLVAMELHPKEGRLLKEHFKRQKNVAIHQRNGYEGLRALTPPASRRGLVMIDPSYEVKTEYKQVVDELEHAIQRWPQGVYLIWYPILVSKRDESKRFKNAIRRLNPNGLTCIELMVKSDDESDKATGMIGSGMLIINEPWGLIQQLAPLIKQLHKDLADDEVPAKLSKVEQLIKPA